MSLDLNIDFKLLLEAGVYFGHKKNLWNPKMADYIYGVRNGVHIIDLQKTAYKLLDAMKVIYSVASKNGRILIVNTKKQTADITKEVAEKSGQYYINHRWLGGMLTNWPTVSSSIKTLEWYDDILNNKTDSYTKKEIIELTRKRDKLERAIGGIKNMGGMPDILFIVDVNVHSIAVKEAKILGIPVIGVVDTNSSTDFINHIIPGNDDSRKAIATYYDLLLNATIQGMQDAINKSGEPNLKSENLKSDYHEKEEKNQEK